MDALPHRARFRRVLRTVPAGALSLALLTCAALPAAAQAPVQPTMPAGQGVMTPTAGLISQIVAGQNSAAPQEETFSYTVSADGTSATIIGYSGTDATITTYDDPSVVTVTAMGQDITLAVPDSAQSYLPFLSYLG